MEPNFLILFIAALIPLILGSIWYSPRVFGNVWIRTAEITVERSKSGNRLLIFALTYLFGFFVAFTLMGITIHQIGFMQVISEQPGFGVPGSEVQQFMEDFMAGYGNFHRDVQHGLLHGGVVAITFALPLIAISALFERRGWTYIGVHFGFWFITLMLMSGLICHFV